MPYFSIDFLNGNISEITKINWRRKRFYVVSTFISLAIFLLKVIPCILEPFQ